MIEGVSIPTPFLLAALVTAVCLTGCKRQHAWQQAGWRPAQPAQSIVAGSVLAVESLLEVMPRERLAAVHSIAADERYSLVAHLARGLKQVGANPEQLLSVRPDLVLVDAYTQAETLAVLSAANVPVIRTLDPQSFADIEANLRTLGRVTHLEEAVAEIIAVTQKKLTRLRAAGKPLSEWRLLSLDGAMHTLGKGSLFDVIVKTAGARNLATENGVGAFRKLDIEEVLAWRPDAIVLLGSPPEGGGLPKWADQCPGLSLLTCIKKGRVLYVPRRLLTTTSHRLVDSAEYVQRRLMQWGKP